MRVRRASWAAGLLAVIAGCVVRSPTSPTVDAGCGAASRHGRSGRTAGARSGRRGESRRPGAPLAGARRPGRRRSDAVRPAATALVEHATPTRCGRRGSILLAGLAAHREGDLADARHWLADALPRLDDAVAVAASGDRARRDERPSGRRFDRVATRTLAAREASARGRRPAGSPAHRPNLRSPSRAAGPIPTSSSTRPRCGCGKATPTGPTPRPTASPRVVTA